MNNPVVIAYGGGTNSAALVVGMIERGYPPPTAILFANTGGELPGVYAHIVMMSGYLVSHGYPPITAVQRVKRDQSLNSLEWRYYETNTLPSIAYGLKGCSHKFKIQPQEKWCNNHFKAHWKAGGKVIRYLGYDFAEKRRWMKAMVEDEKYYYQFPLVEWEWTRDDCIAAITRAGLPQPGKSACFFCPSSKKSEVAALRTEHPLLFKRALDMETRALPNLKTVKGLGRSYAWRDLDKVLAQKEDDAAAQCDYCVDFSSESEK
jgi:hypothetical protein